MEKIFLGEDVLSRIQGPGGWYIENSLTTIGQKDPVISEYNRTLWNSGNDKDKEIVRKQKRKLSYYANIYVIRILPILQMMATSSSSSLVRRSLIRSWQQCNYEFEDETPINPFDFWPSANFKLKIRKVDGYWN